MTQQNKTMDYSIKSAQSAQLKPRHHTFAFITYILKIWK